MGVLPAKIGKKSTPSIRNPVIEKMPSLQDAIMYTEIPAKMRKIRQPKDFALE